ncbi:molybdate ABC transporter substrate-binding protein [Palleronia caenipelagi]|uniref:Molybdate ABC transporter substrate-binding protein n=1 Tax=Palleronia caenipelagi TaxID=2489174 RepID=A0A547QA73_9RHOB|nr:molybdate ABC transporter substrate-binding protein [Palleronia caenipelagi]TRD23307.1 molybdate ABC transporter substrate-binding protein [Palleronia caenipelagi]
MILRSLASLALTLLPTGLFADPVRIAAPVSLKGAFDAVVAKIVKDLGVEIVPVYGGTSLLARQILTGAPYDIFISANAAWMDEVADSGRLVPGTRHDLLTNRLVVAGNAPSPERPLDDALTEGQIAMALTDAIPAGIYGKQALLSIGMWDDVEPRVIETADVRAALALVARGEVPLGIVYATDVFAEERVDIVARFDVMSHDPIVYPLAMLTSAGTDALRVMAALSSDEVGELFAAHGFQRAD